FDSHLRAPRAGGRSEGEPEPLLTQPPLGLGGGILRPSAKSILDPRKRLGLAFAPVLPWEIAVPTLPHSIGGAGGARLAHQREISDDERRQARRVLAHDAVAIAEGIELLDMAEGLAGLPLNPGAQPDLQGAVLGFERARRQGLDRSVTLAARGQPDCQHTGLLHARRYDHR